MTIMILARALPLAALALAAAPVAAQQAAVSPAAAASWTPENDVACAAWASFIVGAYSSDQSVQSAYVPMIYMFLGRYEAATGKDFSAALSVVTNEFEADRTKLEAQDALCEPMKADIARRLNIWASATDAAASPQAGEAQSPR